MFDSNTEILKCDIKIIFFEYLAEIMKKATRKAIIIVFLNTYNNTVKDLEWSYKREGY